MRTNCVLIMITFLSLISCDKDENLNEYIFEFDEPTFRQEKTAWENANYQNYSYTFSRESSSFGYEENNITVINGIAVGDNEDMDAYTISEIYNNCENIANSYLSGSMNNGAPFHISYYFKYNKEYHIPTRISFTQYNMPPGGGGHSSEISNFKVIE
ncbi:hypothetical protein [Paenimyroides viscosum]|uniref:Uncharacterized protein n=1 Tax=Paenimyroides viscosum TaxID=2488729 RepID=A0A3P1B693_9FLAO|nr:hypothetical protein [Paenimyroides viscosum]RRA96093.1 hypothetical protein EG242_04190 [Paenimyroides viscosum]